MNIRRSSIGLALALTLGLACSSTVGGSTGAAGTAPPAGSAGSGEGGTAASGTAGGSGAAGAAGTAGAGTGTMQGNAGAGNSGVSGTGGLAGAAAPAGVGGGMAGPGGSGFPNPKSYACNLVLGVSITRDWFLAGFETYVDDAKWEAMAPEATGMSFVEMWADPNGAPWSFPKLSPCSTNPTQPERVIFTAANWTYTTTTEWVTALEGFVETVQQKLPGVREIDLMTMLRAPDNMLGPGCTSTEDIVQPFIDAAIQTVVANHPQLVRVAPEFYAPSCDIFTGGGPHLTDAGKSAAAKLYGETYGAEL